MNTQEPAPAAVEKSCPAGQFFAGDGACSYLVNPSETMAATLQQPTSCEQIVLPVAGLGVVCLVLMVACLVIARRYYVARKAFDDARKQYDQARTWYEERLEPSAVIEARSKARRDNGD